MKKVFSISLCICLFFCLSGCAPDSAETTASSASSSPTTTAPTTESTSAESTEYVDPSVNYNAPLTTVSVPLVTQTELAEDGTKLFIYTYQEISLTLADANVADAVIVDFLNQTDYSNSANGDLLAAAKADQATAENWSPYSFSILYHPTRLDQNILSFFGSEETNTKTTGYSHANVSLTYDLQTGASLELRDILVANYSAEDLVELIVAELDANDTAGTLYADYSYIVSDMFNTNTLPESWYFTDSGLCFYFAPYEIAPNSQGTVTVEIPYDQLGGLVKDAYFPEEQVTFQGEAVITAFSEGALDNYTQFTELILSDGNEKHLLSASGTLMDVRIEFGNWSADGATFTPTATIFAAAALTDGDAVMIQASSEELAGLCLTYTAAGQVITKALDVTP